MAGSEPIHVQVYGDSEPATRATVDKLRLLGIEPEVTPAAKGRAFMRYQNYTMTPVVLVWIGEGKRRHVYMSWEGHNPHMLELAARIGNEDG
ncbi:hypothetical protein SPF06_00885 [Sinomonas sp. JGH33]|uniref:Uncharacterized protein n=1 Tax=Sinomonas terricola TaxID=3110330 RepID=A0ABU5T0U6_9MICC|nr:hypothetical protein [Sinomonas sp. JGH33]MEA5453265.1 hypothetical protein [Sinomonas sp. JGH33]